MLLVRDAVAAATGVANLRAQGLVVYPAALTARLDQGTWLGVSDVLAAGATATSVSMAAAALTQVSVLKDVHVLLGTVRPTCAARSCISRTASDL